jgi:hypothetical protein
MDVIKWNVSRRELMTWLCGAAGTAVCPAWSAELDAIAPQPYFASVARALEALAKLGAPVAPDDADRIAALARQNDRAGVAAAEEILARYTLARLSIGADESLSIEPGAARPVLVEQGWKLFLVRVGNNLQRPVSMQFGGVISTPAQLWPALGAMSMSQRGYLFDTLNKAPLVEKLWMAAQMHGAGADGAIPLTGFQLEYHILQLYSRDRGRRRGSLSLALPKPGQSMGQSMATTLAREFEFECLPSRDVSLAIRDSDGQGCVAALTIKDAQGHVYPLQTMRLAPDMFFHAHIYRGDGETVRLPEGRYTIESRRGPEYLVGMQTVDIGAQRRIEIRLERWIDPARWGWYSGDTHIHAAGCLHYQVPTEGVTPETMIRHVRGEALSIGQVLTWGPGWYYQKQFFTGHTQSPKAALEHPELQAANNAGWKPTVTAKDGESLLRYDVEVSAFPSSQFGHLMLLRLKEQEYPGTKQIEEWPSWNLPILQWAKAQGALGGYAHCAFGMVVASTQLPNYEIPPFNSNGTNEAIVDVTHGAVDFLSGCNLFPLAELNAWYHMLNCGYRLAMVGETDYPCVSGERPGVGRTYVQLERRPVDDSGYEAWIKGIRDGRLYCGDGRSHVLDFEVEGRRSGEELTLDAPQMVMVKAKVAAYLELGAVADTSYRGLWHLENARIDGTRNVAVELIVNGIAVDRVVMLADGSPREFQFKTQLERSSWVALRIMPSVHTHPVFVQIDRKPIRASKRSAQWCRACVDKIWEMKSSFIRESERAAAARAFDHARAAYDAIASESEAP